MAAGDAVQQDGQYEFWSPNGRSILMGWGTPVRVIKTTGLLGLAPIDGKDESRDSAHGSFYGGAEYMKGRTFDLELAVEDNGIIAVEPLIDSIHAAMQPTPGEGVFTLKRRNKVKRSIGCKVRRSDFSGEYGLTEGLGFGAAQFFAADPRLYENPGHADRITPGTATGGREYPKTYPYAYGGTITPGGVLTANNIGNIPTYPILRIFGPCNRPSVINTTIDQEMQLNMAISAGSYVEVDMDIRSCLIDGLSTRRAAVDPHAQFWPLIPGENQLRFINFDTNVTCFVEVEWRSAWANG